MLKKHEIHWAAILLESGFVVLGILLALLVNNWRENRKAEQRAETALASIVEELRTNRDAVHVSAEYHGEVSRKLWQFRLDSADDKGAVPDIALFNQGFVRLANTSSHAWEAASFSGALELVPYEDLVLASRLYQSQDRYRRASNIVGDEIYRRIFDGGPEAVLAGWRNLNHVVGTVVYLECELARAYRDVLPQLEIGTGQREPASTASVSAETAVNGQGPAQAGNELPQFCNQIPQR